MQTFLPYSNFRVSAMCLDNKRLGKQRVEAYQILRTLRGESSGWKHHPAVKMWRGYEDALCIYLNECIEEWVRRGFKNNMKKMAHQELPIPKMPWWLGHPIFHSAHRAALLAKNPDWYQRFGWDDVPHIHYWWPAKQP